LNVTTVSGNSYQRGVGGANVCPIQTTSGRIQGPERYDFLGYLPSIWNHYSSSFIVLQQSLLQASWVRLTYSLALPMNGTKQKETAPPHLFNDGKTILIRP